MQYLIMITIVAGLAAVDFITGIIRAYIKSDLSSRKMRIGGLNKLSELLVMGAACGLEIGMEQLGIYYQNAELATIIGSITAVMVFVYLVLMELVSILENYAEVNPDAKWASGLIKRLRSFGDSEDNSDRTEKQPPV